MAHLEASAAGRLIGAAAQQPTVLCAADKIALYKIAARRVDSRTEMPWKRPRLKT